jgi:hypothetical protein
MHQGRDYWIDPTSQSAARPTSAADNNRQQLHSDEPDSGWLRDTGWHPNPAFDLARFSSRPGLGPSADPSTPSNERRAGAAEARDDSFITLSFSWDFGYRPGLRQPRPAGVDTKRPWPCRPLAELTEQRPHAVTPANVTKVVDALETDFWPKRWSTSRWPGRTSPREQILTSCGSRVLRLSEPCQFRPLFRLADLAGPQHPAARSVAQSLSLAIGELRTRNWKLKNEPGSSVSS